MTSPQQEFNTLSRAYCLSMPNKVVKECRECGGRGYIEVISDAEDDKDKCPSCAPEADKWRKLADELWWNSLPKCMKANPTYSNPADIARALKRMGLLERFVNSLVYSDGVKEETGLTPVGLANILLDPTLFLEAGANFLREVVGQS